MAFFAPHRPVLELLEGFVDQPQTNKLQLTFLHQLSFEQLRNLSFSRTISFLDSLESFPSTNIYPCTLHCRQCTLIDDTDVALYKLDEHRAVELPAVNALRSNPSKYFIPGCLHLHSELFSQGTILKLVKALQVLLIFDGSHHRQTVPVRKVPLKQPTNFILVFNSLAGSFLLFEGIFQVLLAGEFPPGCIDKLKREISHNPQKRGELSIIIFPAGLGFDVLGEIDDQIQSINRIFIDVADAIVDEGAAQQQTEQEYSAVMIRIFVHASETFSVDQDSLEIFIGATGNGLLPDP